MSNNPVAGGKRAKSGGARGRARDRAVSAFEAEPAAGGNSVGDKAVDSVDESDSANAGIDPTYGGNKPASAELVDDQSDHGELQGADLARAALQAAREQSKARGRKPGKRVKSGARRSRGGWSGARADDRDPQTLGRLVSRVATDHGWSDKLAGGHVFGGWSQLVGDEIAEHCKPIELREGVLTVQAESTAWATQLRLLQRKIVQHIGDGLGSGLVKRIKVQGPAAPSWRYGPRHIPGRGPRDTYG